MAAAASSGAVFATAGALKGQVLDRGTRTPLVGATVSLYQSAVLVDTSTAGAYGVYSLAAVAPGTYVVVASQSGYAPQTKAGVTVVAATTTYVNFALNPVCLTGEVRIAGTATALGGVTVAAYQGGVLKASVLTDTDGIYRIGGLTGTYAVTATKSGYLPQTETDVVVTATTVTDLDFALEAVGALKGQVKDADTGSPLVGVTVSAYLGGVLQGTGVTAAPWGVYNIAGDLPAGTYTLIASGTGYLRQTKAYIAVSAGATTNVNFNLKLNPGEVIATVSVGYSPQGVAVNPTTNRVYVSNFNGDSVTVMDGATNTVIATVPVGSYPARVAVNPVTNRIYVTNYYDSNVSVINGATNAVITTVSVGEYPQGVAVNTETNRIYVGNLHVNTVSVIDGVSNTVIATIGVGHQPSAVAVNPVTNRVYVTNKNSDTLSIIDGATNAVIKTMTVGTDPLGVAVNPSTNLIYVANASSHSVSVIDGSTSKLVRTISASGGPLAVAVDTATNRVYVAGYDSAYVGVINGVNNTVIGKVHAPAADVAANPVTHRVYAADRSYNHVIVINGDPSSL